jgi:hypothetical protein
MKPNSRKLSALQKDILCCLWFHYEDLLERGLTRWLRLGIRVKDIRDDEPKTAADRAAFSRSLRRLEQRGLIVRMNISSGMPEDDPRVAEIRVNERRSIRLRVDDPMVRRTDHIILTAAGVGVAKRLT